MGGIGLEVGLIKLRIVILFRSLSFPIVYHLTKSATFKNDLLRWNGAKTHLLRKKHSEIFSVRDRFGSIEQLVYRGAQKPQYN